MSYMVEIDLGAHKQGDLWLGIPQIGPVLVNGERPAGELERVRMTLRQGNVVYRLDSDEDAEPDALILITDSEEWVAEVPEVAEFVPRAGVWEWDMEFQEEGRGWFTFYGSKAWEVEQGVAQ